MDGIHDYDDYGFEYDGEEDNYETVEYVEEDVPFREDISLVELYEDCAKPTLISASDQICWLFISCLLFKLFTQLVPVRAPLCHIVSALCGILSLYSLLGVNAVYTCAIAISTYFAVIFCFRGRAAHGLSYRIVAILMFAYLLIREYVEVLPAESWEQIRGIHMIMVLKALSVCYEVSNFSRPVIPPLLDYAGYILCPATIIFGPWIPLNTYYRVFEKHKWTVDWVTSLFATAIFSFLCLTFSSCWVYWLFLGVKSNWLLAVRDALSVRTSNYFVAFMSESTCLLSGLFSPGDKDLTIEVSKPWNIEAPRSLVDVVVSWNIPMHQWLKIHVFRPAKNLGPFCRIVLTFFISALLHGLNFYLSVVLLSLGFYTYIEYTLREKLASIFDACIRSRQCSDCKHAYKSNHPITTTTNFAFGLLAYFHLSYLGAIMDKRYDNGTNIFIDGIWHHLETWSKLGYASHWVALGSYVFTLLI